MTTVHTDYHPTKQCKHPEWTYGEICVKCGECGRFDVKYKCVNCGHTEGKKPLSVYSNWGQVEFYDAYVPICPKCKPLFKNEDRTQFEESYKAKIISCHIKDFKRRQSNGNKRRSNYKQEQKSFCS